MTTGGMIAARMNRLPITRQHRFATLAIGFGLFFDIYEVFLAGVLSTALGSEFHLGKAQLPWLLSSAFLGMFIGALTLGRLADRIGRRGAFLASVGGYSVFSLLAAFSTGPAMLVAARFLAGIGIGAEPPVSDAYLGDLLPPRQRGRYTALAYTLSFLGVPLAGFLGRWLVPVAPLGVAGWRWMFVIGSVGAVIVFALRNRLPESPRWLESVGRTAEAESVVRVFEEQARWAGADLPEPSVEAGVVRHSGSARALLRPPLRRRTLMMVLFHLLQTWGYYGFGTLVPIVLVAKGYSITDSLLFSALTFLGYPVGSALSLLVIEWVERKVLVMSTALGMAMFGVAFGSAATAPVIVVLGFLYTVTSNVFSNAFHIYQAEIFPTALRSTAAGGTYSLSRLSTGFMPFILLPLLNSRGPGVLFGVVAGALVLLVLNIGLFGPRATGLALETISGPTGGTSDPGRPSSLRTGTRRQSGRTSDNGGPNGLSERSDARATSPPPHAQRAADQSDRTPWGEQG